MKFPPKKKLVICFVLKNNILKLQTFSHETEFSINCHQIDLKIKVRCTAHNMTTNSLKYNTKALIKHNKPFHFILRSTTRDLWSYNSTKSLPHTNGNRLSLSIQLGTLWVVFVYLKSLLLFNVLANSKYELFSKQYIALD